MYKVFINEKRLTFSNTASVTEKSIVFEGVATLEMAIDLLENTSSPNITIYGDNPEFLFNEFSSLYKQIEAAGGIVRNQKDEILFIFRLGKWDLPKGKIEKGESIREAALREIEEETGLKELEIISKATTTYHTYTERNLTKVLKTTHWFHMIARGSQTPTPQAEEGITEATWKSIAVLETEIFPKTFKNIQLLLQDNI